MRNLINISIAGVFSVITATALSPLPTLAQTPAFQVISRETAATNTTNVQVWPGRSTAIDFSQTNEIITYILLADPSRIVYNTDAELSSNQAKTLFLKRIEPLRFPGTTTASITNLSVKTRTPDGQQRLYTFNIVPSSGKPAYSGVSISSIIPDKDPTLAVGNNQVTKLSDIERGLEIALKRGYTAANDPVVLKVRQFLALVKNTTSIPKAAQQVNLPLPVVFALGQLGLNNFRFPEPPLPLPQIRFNQDRPSVSPTTAAKQ